MRNNQVVSVKNRHGKTISFARIDDVIVVTGFDEMYKVGYQLDYSIAYEKYREDTPEDYKGFTPICLERFSDLMHASSDLADKYSKHLVTNDRIATFDPMGGKFLCVGMDLGTIHEKMFRLEVESIEIKEGKTVILKLK